MVSGSKEYMKVHHRKMSVPRMILLFFLFLFFSLGAIAWALPHIYDWVTAMYYHKPVLIFSKKLTAIFGASPIILSCAIRIVFLKEKVYQLDKYFITISVISLFLLFIFPSIMESVVESYVQEYEYGYCEGASYKGQDCYTIDEANCKIETEKREQMLKDFWGD